jgi:hypothetical protein
MGDGLDRSCPGRGVGERAGRDRRHLDTFKVLTFLMPGVRDVRRNAGFLVAERKEKSS